MPLDAGHIAEERLAPGADDRIAALRPIRIVLAETGHVGAALRAARESLGLAPDDIAQFTRVRPGYIAAIEAFDFAALPARPFVVGYVRAYALAMGLEPEAVVARFHAEAPKPDGRLRPPGGLSHDAFAGIRRLLAVGAVVVAAVAVWNVARRAELHAAEPASAPVPRPARTPPTPGPAQIGAPLPTPPEATTPPVYQTPGLTAPVAASGPVAPLPRGALTDGSAGGTRFVPGGAVYGAAAGGSDLVLQAHASTSLIVRGPSGAIYFARLLASGEAWRGAAADGLTAEAAEPSAVEVFVGGASHGRLLKRQTPLAALIQNDAPAA